MSEQGKDAERLAPTATDADRMDAGVGSVLRADIREFAEHLRDDPPVYGRVGSTIVLRDEIWEAVVRERHVAALLLDRYAATPARPFRKARSPKARHRNQHRKPPTPTREPADG